MRLRTGQKDTRRRRIQRVWYLFLGSVADFIQDLLGLFQNERAKAMPSEASHWSTEQAIERCERATPMDDARNYDGDSSVFIIDDATVTKLIYGSSNLLPEQQREAMNMRFILEHTTIPIPNVYAVLPDRLSVSHAWIVMDYVHGERMDRAWPRLSVWQKLRVVWTLRSYIRQLRRIQHPRSSIPGPLGPGPRQCPEGTMDSVRDVGPFASADELTAFINTRSMYNGKVDVPPRGYEVPEPLTFTHADLNMRNIILDDDGRIWILDWDWSGFYPKSWEFISMSRQAESHPLGPLPISWRRCVPFITNPDFGRYRWLVGLYP